MSLDRDLVARARIRLAVQFALLCAALLIGAGGAVYGYVRHTLHAAFDAAHALAVRSVLETLDPTPTRVTVRSREFQEEFDELQATLGVIAVEVWSADGTRLAAASSHGASHLVTPPDGPARELRASPVGLIAIRRERTPPERGGALLVVSRNAETLEGDLLAFRRALWLFVPLAVLASLGVGWWMAGRSLRPIRDLVQQQRAFMADASHELRTPLAIIQTHADTALDDGVMDHERARRALDVVSRTAADLGVLVGDLMYLARADLSVVESQRVLVDLEDLVEETLENFGPMARERGSRLQLETSKDAHVLGDPHQLKRLVSILVDNTLRHADPCDVEVALLRTNKGLVFRVGDAGPGIPEEMAPRMFERFFRGEGSRRRTGGSGLGLAIARSIVSAHGGEIELRKNERGGTTAFVTLHLAR